MRIDEVEFEAGEGIVERLIKTLTVEGEDLTFDAVMPQ